MSRSPARAEFDLLARRVSEILYYVWDHIGVIPAPQARDEYDGYVPLIVGLLRKGKSKDEIARHLYQIEGETMGLSVGSRPSDHTEKVAEILIDHYEALAEAG
jgi:hypothetical protein